jgi:uncharacterized membrane protein YkvA (DUF1232 family)
MKNSHLLILMRETKLSPEQLAKRLGISNMTIRRWMKNAPGKTIPSIYEKTVWDAVYQMVAEGMLSPESTFVHKAVKESQKYYFSAAMKSLGFKASKKGKNQFSMDSIMKGLSEIGAQEGHQSQVERNQKKILSFTRLGRDWNERISALMKVVGNTRLSLKDKLVASGALFYLLCPLDLIPDNVPVFGMMDDYCVLGLAADHYGKKFMVGVES